MKDLDFPQAHWMSYRLREVLLRDLETLPPLTTKDGGDVRLLLMQAIDLVESHEYETIEWAKKAIQLRAVLNEHAKGGERA